MEDHFYDMMYDMISRWCFELDISTNIHQLPSFKLFPRYLFDYDSNFLKVMNVIGSSLMFQKEASSLRFTV